MDKQRTCIFKSLSSLTFRKNKVYKHPGYSNSMSSFLFCDYWQLVEIFENKLYLSFLCCPFFFFSLRGQSVMLIHIFIFLFASCRIILLFSVILQLCWLSRWIPRSTWATTFNWQTRLLSVSIHFLALDFRTINHVKQIM